MSLGAITVVSEVAATGPVKFSRVTIVGDGAYPAGGSVGFSDAFNVATGENRTVLAVQPVGNNGDTNLEYTPDSAPVVATVVASTDLFSTVALHGLSSGDAVEFVASNLRNANFPDPVLPGGVAAKTVYYVIASGLTTHAFKVSATVGGSSIDVTSAGQGEFEVVKQDKLLVRVMSTGVESATANQSGTTYTALVTSY